MTLLERRKQLLLIALLGGPGSGGAREGAGRPRSSIPDSRGEDISAQSRMDIVSRRATEVAEQLGVDPKIIHVVDKDPPQFKVGDVQFSEAGHFDPRTGQIEINARNAYNPSMYVTNGLVAHECFHAMYDKVQEAHNAERRELTALLKGPDGDKYWTKAGFARPEMVAELSQRFPVSAVFAKTWGGEFLNTSSENDKSKVMQTEAKRSATEYAKAYWSDEAMRGSSGSLDRARNETLAETTRYLVTTTSTQAAANWHEALPSRNWVTLAKGIHAAYGNLK